MQRAFSTRLSFLLAGCVVLTTGCIITITDDVADTANDELGDTTDSSTSMGESSSSSSGETTTDSTSMGETTSSTDATDTTTDSSDTGTGDCAPMAAMNGPEDCFMPRGWFWTGEGCEQITCTCQGDDCNALFPDENACLASYGDCPVAPPPDSCDPQLAEGVGFCELFLGWKWDGLDCVPLSGCECSGPDCGNLYPEVDLCKDAHLGCGFGPDCTPDDAIGSGDCDLFLGVVWTGDNCLGISGCECIGTDCDNLPLDEQTCWDEHGLCEPPPPPECLPEDAIGVGMCDAFWGYAWNGSECVGLSGCACEGLDCETLPFEPGLCELEHEQCGGNVPPCQGVMDATGVGLCQLFFGYKWNGMACEGVSGCTCEGQDCDFLYPEVDVCQLDNLGCL